MPYTTEWVNPELFFEHNGVKIYRVYKNDDLKDPLYFYFTTDSSDEQPEHDFTFDVRDLIPKYIKISFIKDGHPEFLNGIQDGVLMKKDMIKTILKYAIENKTIEVHPNN